MNKDQEIQHLPTPVIGGRYLRVTEKVFSKSFYLFLAFNCTAIIGGVFLKPYVSTKIVFLVELLLLTSIVVRSKKAIWSHLFLPAVTDTTPLITADDSPGTNVEMVHAGRSIIASVKSMLENKDVCLSIGSLFTAYVIAEIVQLLDIISRSGGLAGDVFLALTLSSLFPLAAAVIMRNRLTLTRVFGSVRVPNFSYSCCYAGFTSLIFLLSYLPHCIGQQFSGWLNACMLDANMPGSEEPSLLMQLAVSTAMFVVLMTTFRHAMVRFSAGYQLFLKRAFVIKDSWFDAFRATVKISPIRVELPDRHPHLHNAVFTAIWIALVYAVLFSGVAFCPGPLGETIRNHYQACLRDANLDGNLRTNFGLLLFIASVVAAYMTIPVAVMTCSFLSTKKMKFILASSEGILTPCDKKTLIGYSPILQWEKLSRISLEKADNEKKQFLKFSFDQASPLKLKVSEMKKESLAALLNTADEYSKKCLIEKPVLDLKKQLNDETKSHTMAETKRFSSTVFSLLKAGDDLKGSYRIVRKLAGKSLSAVYLARNAANELVVIKEFILPENVDACDRLDIAFTREYNILKELQHPGIAKVIESFEERTAKYLVLEHIAGTDLRALVNKSGPRSEASVKSWALSIASIMSYLHAQEPAILHRDLTPDNLMIDNDGRLKLIDFGASHQFIEGVTGTLIGKQCYIAPEQLRGKPSIESDIYSFGCTLYFLLTGRDPKALQQSDLQSSNVGVNSDLRQLILKCTEFEPVNRLHSFSEVISELSSSSSSTLSYVTIKQENDVPTTIVETSYGH